MRAVVFLVGNVEGRGPRERIGNEVGLAGLVDDAEVVLRQVASPASLSTGKVLRGLPILEVLMIRPDIEGFGKALEELTPVLQGLDDSKHLAIPDLVVALGRTHGLRTERDGMPELIVGIELSNNSAGSVARSISFYPGWIIDVPHGEHRAGRKRVLERLEGLGLCETPVKRDVLLRQIVQRSADL